MFMLYEYVLILARTLSSALLPRPAQYLIYRPVLAPMSMVTVLHGW